MNDRFEDDLTFLRRHLPDLIVLGDDGARIAIAPEYQGRVMTSATRGADGLSHGWIHRELIAARTARPHITPVGGEDRLWLGPEGGPFALYFPPGVPFDLEHWQVPHAIDTAAWTVGARDHRRVVLTHEVELTNYAGTPLAIGIERAITLFECAAIRAEFDASDADVVAYASDNTIENRGPERWTKERGLVSLWVLGMFRPSRRTTVVIPLAAGAEPIVNDAYFGAVPRERLRIDRGIVAFSGDGEQRSKIGIARAAATPLLGSWDAEHGVLTLVDYTLPDEAPHGYVDSRWEALADPYAGDVLNSYNDGPLGPGRPPLGPFYELETSSPALALAPGERASHRHRTIHFEGPRATLDRVAQRTLGADLATIEGMLTSHA